MGRHCTGLRNRHRKGARLSKYARVRKSETADKYGAWATGKRNGTERINGKVTNWQPSTQETANQ